MLTSIETRLCGFRFLLIKKATNGNIDLFSKEAYIMHKNTVGDTNIIPLDDLISLSKKIESTKSKIEEKKKAVELEENKRNYEKRGFLASLSSLFLKRQPTQSETDLKLLNNELIKNNTQAQSLSVSYLAQQTTLRINCNENDFQAIFAEEEKIKKHQGRLDRVLEIHDMVYNTRELFKTARDRCSSASSTESIDLFSSNSAISAISYFETSDAKDSVDTAISALSELIKKIPKKIDDVNISAPDDFFDTILDMSSFSFIDFSSYDNMVALDEAVEKCGKVIDNLGKVIINIDTIVNNIKLKIETYNMAILKIRKPYFDAVRSEIPDNMFPFFYKN